MLPPSQHIAPPGLQTLCNECGAGDVSKPGDLNPRPESHPARAYYNEIDPYAAQWLRNLIAAGHIAPGDVDERSIVDVHPDDLKGYTQCHFFAGIGGWSYAARLAGWPDDRPLWTGSEPCQPYSVAGKGLAEADERYLRPHVHRLVSARRPPVYMGEQVAAAAGKNWLDRVHSDMESIGYTCRSVVVPACAVDAPHRRGRLWFVADTYFTGASPQREQRGGEFGGASGDQGARGGDVILMPFAGMSVEEVDAYLSLADADSISGQKHSNAGRRENGSGAREVTGPGRADNGDVADTDEPGPQGRVVLRERGGERSAWADGVEWAIGADGKARRVEPGICLLAHGVPARVGKLRAYGNAIVPQVAAEIIGAYLDIREAA